MTAPRPVTQPPVRCYDRACRHHHAEGDPFDPSLISGPPCAGCRACQAIAIIRAQRSPAR